MGPDVMILVFWVLSQLFHSPLSLSSRGSLVLLHFLPIRVVLSVYLRDLSLCFIQPSILHDVLCIKVKIAEWQYTALTYSFPDLELVCCSMSSFHCCFLTCIQVSPEAGKVVWYSHLFKNFLQFIVIHTVEAFIVVNEAEVDILHEFSCFLYEPTDVGNLISGSSALSKSSLYIWNFSVHTLLKPGLKDFEYYLASIWNEHKFFRFISTIFLDYIYMH